MEQLAASEIPRTDEFEIGRFKIRQVPGRQAPAIDARNGRDHPVGRSHGSALAERSIHDVAISELDGFRGGENPVGETVEAKPSSRRATLWSGRALPMPKATPTR